ncbi:MAG: hypothetical protein ISS79_13395, partial [Phycisphaerae bacterium]|nr:hypothetical protein [Phycisphaerae bacterium]
MKKTLTKKAGIISIITVVWVMTMPAVASTNVPAGPIIMDTTWAESGSPYILNGSIVVGFDATLTIDPNVQVKLKSGFGLTIGSDAFGKGTLVAEGTQAEPITFTSIKDPCDVNDPPRPGDWVQIHFSDFAEDAEPDGMGGFTGCVMDHVILEYAGQFAQAAILAERSSPMLYSCMIRHNAGIGIAADGSTSPPINISNCEIWDNPGRGISIS